MSKLPARRFAGQIRPNSNDRFSAGAWVCRAHARDATSKGIAQEGEKRREAELQHSGFLMAVNAPPIDCTVNETPRRLTRRRGHQPAVSGASVGAACVPGSGHAWRSSRTHGELQGVADVQRQADKHCSSCVVPVGICAAVTRAEWLDAANWNVGNHGGNQRQARARLSD